MQDDSDADSPQQRFKIAVLQIMESRNIDTDALSEATDIPVSRLKAILGRKPGGAFFSDLVVLAIFFEISIDSFFT